MRVCEFREGLRVLAVFHDPVSVYGCPKSGGPIVGITAKDKDGDWWLCNDLAGTSSGCISRMINDRGYNFWHFLSHKDEEMPRNCTISKKKGN